jgi:hypothetical protein
LRAAGFTGDAWRESLREKERAQRTIVAHRIHEMIEALVNSFAAPNCLFNRKARLIGEPLPAILCDLLAASVNARMAGLAAQVAAIAPLAQATTADAALAVGTAILPCIERSVPMRCALLQTP